MAEILLLGSGNIDKARELAVLLADLPWEVRSLKDYPDVAEPEEDGDTFEANALLKARFYGTHFGVPCVADDSGLEVDALNGAPGVYSARYAGPGCSYSDNNRKLLEAIDGVAWHERTARFRCCAALVMPDGAGTHVEMGTVEGHIAAECAGENGFGYDPLFVPNGHDATFGEMAPEAKHAISHRAAPLPGCALTWKRFMELLDTSAASLERAAEALRAGQVIAYPTETVYGLGVDPFNTAALDRLFQAKARDRGQAVLLIIGDKDQLDRAVRDISPRARACMAAFWPGPLSLLLPKHPDLPEAVAPGREKICVRCPGLPWARQLCDNFGGPITSTSANQSGEPPVDDLRALNLTGVALGIDAGPLGQGVPSTILDPDSGDILREGAITRADLHRIFP